jgi:hypothetical protein
VLDVSTGEGWRSSDQSVVRDVEVQRGEDKPVSGVGLSVTADRAKAPAVAQESRSDRLMQVGRLFEIQ